MITKININDNLYIELESMHHGYIVKDNNTVRVMFNIADNYLNINEMHDLSEQIIKQVIKKLCLDGFINIEKKQKINNKRKETLSKIIQNTDSMDRRELRHFKDRLSEVEEWIEVK